MNQLPMTAISMRQPGTAESPDLLFVTRRYLWGILAGTAVATVIATGLFYYLKRTSPYYVSSVQFQVLPPPKPVDQQAVVTDFGSSQDEIASFIRRQEIYIKGDEIISQILQSDAFQRDYHPNATGPSRWLADHLNNPKKQLKQDLIFEPIANAQIFRISMMSKDPVEAAHLVKAIADVYTTQLRKDNELNTNHQLTDLEKIVNQQETAVQTKEKALADFRTGANISAVMQRQTVEIALLGQLDTRVVEAQAANAFAQANYSALKKQNEDKLLPLSAQMQQQVDNDPQLRTLIGTQMSYMQEKAANTVLYAPGSSAMNALQSRLDEVQRQIDDTRARLQNEARAQMVEVAKAEVDRTASELQYMEQNRDAEDNKVMGIDRQLAKYQDMLTDLQSDQQVLETLRKRQTVEQLQAPMDDSRVREFGGDPVPAELTDVAWPIGWKFIVPGAALGLLISFGLAYLRELLNTRVRTPRDITKTLQIPLMGYVPDKDDDDALHGDLATAIRTSPTSMVAESFRQIRSRLLAHADGQPARTLLVSSFTPGGGATTVANNLATGMALNDMKVLLIDANFHRPGLRTLYKSLPATGLSDVIADASKLPSAVMQTNELPRMYVMGAGTRPAVGASEILETKAFRELIDQLKSQYDMVIFDGPPLSLVSDAAAIGSRVDGVLPVVRAGVVTRGMVSRVRDQLRQVRANMVGLVLNAVQTHGAGYFKKNYRTFYRYSTQPTPSNRAGVNS